jgi:hypothetical protein
MCVGMRQFMIEEQLNDGFRKRVALGLGVKFSQGRKSKVYKLFSKLNSSVIKIKK